MHANCQLNNILINIVIVYMGSEVTVILIKIGQVWKEAIKSLYSEPFPLRTCQTLIDMQTFYTTLQQGGFGLSEKAHHFQLGGCAEQREIMGTILLFSPLCSWRK